jgi:hypothetical protein
VLPPAKYGVAVPFCYLFQGWVSFTLNPKPGATASVGSVEVKLITTVQYYDTIVTTNS